MDDCNNITGRSVAAIIMVQIPLWTIVTIGLKEDWSKRLKSSDSSMDDCNGLRPAPLFRGWHVQIPLWTIVTRLGKTLA